MSKYISFLPFIWIESVDTLALHSSPVKGPQKLFSPTVTNVVKKE